MSWRPDVENWQQSLCAQIPHFDVCVHLCFNCNKFILRVTKNLEMAVVERNPDGKSLSSSNIDGQVHWLQVNALASLKTHLSSKKGICCRILRTGKSKMSFVKQFPNHIKWRVHNDPHFSASGFKMSQSETIWKLRSCWEGFTAALIQCEHTCLLVSSPCWF